MRIALAQVNPTIGDITGNTQRIAQALESAVEHNCDLLLAPELAILGYPPKDLLLRSSLIKRSEEAVARLAADFPQILAILGSPRRHANASGNGVHNSAAICRNGKIERWYDKRCLPTYDVFDESRYFDPGDAPCVVEHHGRLIGITICEDLWNDNELLGPRRYKDDILNDVLDSGADCIINISASPFVIGKPAFRRRLFSRIATRSSMPVALVNQVGANDDLIFDGHSFVLGSDGGTISAACGFADDLLIADLSSPDRITPPENDMRDLTDALILGIRDYCRKCGFSKTIVALSGGIDSAVVAALARIALGADSVHGIGMPSRHSSQGSIDDARDLANRLSIPFDLIPIAPAHDAMDEMLVDLFAQTGRPPGVAEENIQARLRGNIVMSLSNKTGALLLTTGNKSELAVGYCTLYGDMAGGLAVISDVPKTMVYTLANWLNENHKSFDLDQPPIPENTITKPPSAELRPDQTDQDTLPPYEILDVIIDRYVERSLDAGDIIDETQFDADLVRRICKLIDRNEHKRRQMPVGLKVTGRAFGSGWRMPIAAKINGT